MSHIHYKVIFNRRGTLNKSGKGKVQIRAYQNREYQYFPTGIWIKPKFWNKRLNKVHKHHDSHHMNRLIESIQTSLRKQENHHRDQKGYCSLQDLVQEKDTSSVLKYMKEYMSSNRFALGTHKSKKTTYNYLKKFFNGRELGFTDISLELVESFDEFLRNSNLQQTTIYKHHKNFKAALKHAQKHRVMNIKDNPYAYFKMNKGESKEREFLNSSEIENLESLSYGQNETSKERIRKLFLISIYTGLRFSDVHMLTKANFQKDDKGWLLNFKSRKTNKNVSLPIYNLWKVKDSALSRPERLCLDTFIEANPLELKSIHQLSNQYANRKLKDIAADAEISKELTFHVGRHTFGTQMANKGLNIRLLQQLMDHSDISTTMLYLHLSKRMMNNELEAIEW